MNKEKKIKYLVFIILLGFIVSIFYHYVLGVYLHKGYPSNSFLFIPEDKFMDFYNVYKSRASIYFPFANLIINVFCLIKPAKLALLIFLSLSLGFIIYYFWNNLQGDTRIESLLNTLVFSLFSFPVLFLIDRANFESFVFVFLAAFMYFYQKGEINYAVIPLALAISMKLFPAIFFILLFSDRKYKQILWTILLVILITLCSSWILYGGISEAFSNQFGNSSFYQENYVIKDGGFDFGHSLFGFIKCFIYSFKLNIEIKSILTPYLILVILLAILVSIFVVLYEKVLWKKVALLVVAMCLLPHVSADYKLIYLFIPLCLYLDSESGDKVHALSPKKNCLVNIIYFDYCYLILFGLLLIPKNYRLFKNIYDGVYIDPLLMLSLALVIIIPGIPELKRTRSLIEELFGNRNKIKT